ncbi:D-aminopeptidase [Labrys miyagiensis]
MTEPAKDLESTIQEIVAPFDRTDGPGLAVGILQEGQIRLRKGYGLADVGGGVPNGPDVPMRIASLTKQFLCTVVMMLHEEGRLSIDDDIRTHLPMLPDYGRRITLTDLMSNQSGIRDFLELRLLSGGNFADHVCAGSSMALVESVKDLNFEPGSDFAYCNTGFMLLTRVVEATEERPLEEVFQARIFGPLGMTSTHLVRSDDPAIPGRALPYIETPAGLAPGLWGVPLDGAGGLVSTVDDLLIWAKNLRNPRVVGSPDIFASMTAARPFGDGTPSIYGLGFSVLPYRGAPSFGHHGQLPGVFAELAIFPTLDTAIVLVANTSALNPFVVGRRIADAIVSERLAARIPDPVGPMLDGLYHDRERDAVLEISSTPAGSVSVTTVMMDAPVDAHSPSRFGMMWPMSMLDLQQAEDGGLEGSAGPRSVYLDKLPAFDPGISLADAPGRFYQPELKATWSILGSAEGLRFRIEGPCGRQDFDLRMLAPGLFQARMREEPCGPYRPVLRLSGTNGRRRLTVATDRTFGLAAEEIAGGEHPLP